MLDTVKVKVTEAIDQDLEAFSLFPLNPTEVLVFDHFVWVIKIADS